MTDLKTAVVAAMIGGIGTGGAFAIRDHFNPLNDPTNPHVVAACTALDQNPSQGSRAYNTGGIYPEAGVCQEALRIAAACDALSQETAFEATRPYNTNGYAPSDDKCQKLEM